jgi:chemotaxis-related protein WspD
MSTPQPAAKQNDCWSKIGTRGDQSCPELKTLIHCRNCAVFAQAGRQLLDRPSPEAYQQEWSRLLGDGKSLGKRPALSFCVFRLGAEWLAFSSQVVVEVSEHKLIRRIPFRKDPVFCGLVNIRGELQLCVSLRTLLEIPDAAQDSAKTRRMLVCEKQGVRWVMVVDQMEGIRRCDTADLGKPPATISKAMEAHVKHVLADEGRQIGILDDELVFYQLNRSVQ